MIVVTPNEPNRRSPYFTVREAAEYLRLSPRTVYNLIWQGKLPRRPGKLRFTRDDLERYLANPSAAKA
jgi:excisionase family DNA binding protein